MAEKSSLTNPQPLLRDGVAFHTLEPSVHVFADSQDTVNAVK